MSIPRTLTIGELAARSGVAASTLRFYESQRLITAARTEGNQRRFPREMLRRVAVIRAAQSVGLSLQEIRSAFGALPDSRTPSRKDWQRLSTSWRRQLDERITRLEQLRESLTGCIGCGCLSLQKCRLLNPDDEAAESGPGARGLRASDRQGAPAAAD